MERRKGISGSWATTVPARSPTTGSIVDADLLAVRLVQPTGLSRNRKVVLRDGVFAIESARPGVGYYEIVEGFAIGFSPGGVLVDFDCYSGPEGAPGPLPFELPSESMEAVLVNPQDLGGDTIDLEEGVALMDEETGVWWCAVKAPIGAIRVGSNISFLLDSFARLIGVAIETRRL